MRTKHSAAVLGVGHSRVTRHADVPLGVLAADAARNAAEDAGIPVSAIDGVTSAASLAFDVEGGVRDGHHYVSADLLARQLRLQPTWGTNSTAMVGSTFIDAVRAVEAGACEYALVVRALHSPHGSYGRTTGERATGDAQHTLPYGFFVTAQFAHSWHRYQDKYGSGSREQMATFVVQARENGLRNPDSYWRQHRPQELTVDDYLGARMVSTPLSVFDCDLPVQGAGAFLITTQERALASGKPAAYVHGVASPGRRTALDAGFFPLEIEEAGASHVADLLWSDSGLSAQDVDVANLYDGFSIIAMQWLEGLGFAGRGEAFDFIQDGRTAPDGVLPLNTSGGNLGAGRMHGVPHLIDAIRQVTGRAGEAQVADAAVSLAAIGPPSVGAAVLFGREPLA